LLYDFRVDLWEDVPGKNIDPKAGRNARAIC